MSEARLKLDVVDIASERVVIPVGRRDEGYDDLAIGTTKHRLFLRGPSGRVFVLEAPAEMVEEIQQAIGGT